MRDAEIGIQVLFVLALVGWVLGTYALIAGA